MGDSQRHSPIDRRGALRRMAVAGAATQLGVSTAASKAVTANHGAGVPTQETGVSSNMGILLGWGPKIRAGVQRDADRRGPIPMHHIGATLAELLGCRPPHHSDGAIIREMFV